LGHKHNNRSKFKRIVRAFKNRPQVPVNKSIQGHSVDLGARGLFTYKPDLDNDVRLIPGALIDEVNVIVSGCGKVGYRDRQ